MADTKDVVAGLLISAGVVVAGYYIYKDVIKTQASTGGGTGSGQCNTCNQQQSYTVTVQNQCNYNVSVSYVTPNGTTNVLLLYSNSSQLIQVLANSTITVTLPNGQQQQYGPINSSQTLTVCQPSSSGVSITLQNQCNQSVQVYYTDVNGNSKSTTVSANSSTTVSIQPGSLIYAYPPSGPSYFGPYYNNTTVTVCTAPSQATYSVTVNNKCSLPATLRYTNANGNTAYVTVAPGGSQTIQVQGNTYIYVVAPSTPYTKNVFGPINSNQTITVCQS